jgi:hypothetical protein
MSRLACGPGAVLERQQTERRSVTTGDGLEHSPVKGGVDARSTPQRRAIARPAPAVWGRLLRVSTLAIIVVTVAVACGSGPSEAEALAVGRSSLNGSQMKVSSAVEICIGKSMVSDLGLSTAQKASKQKSFAKLPKAQRAAAFAALDKCVPSDAFAPTFVAQSSGGGTRTIDFEKCLAKQFKGKVGSVLEAFEDPNGGSSTRRLLDKCASGDLATQVLARELGHSQIPDAVIQCTMDKVGPDLKLSDVIAESKDLRSKLQAAFSACKPAK